MGIDKIDVYGINPTYNSVTIRADIYLSSKWVHVDLFYVRFRDPWNVLHTIGPVKLNWGQDREIVTYDYTLYLGEAGWGEQTARAVACDCWSTYSGGYSGSGSGTVYTMRRPNIVDSNIILGGGTTTSRLIYYSDLFLPNNERLSYTNNPNNLNSFQQTGNGVQAGNFTISGFTINTKVRMSFGIVPTNTGGPYLLYITKDVYPVYTALKKGKLVAERVSNTPTSIKASWGAWENLGNLSLNSYIEIVNSENNAVIRTVSISVKNKGDFTFTNVSLDVPLVVRIKVSGNYHDGKAIVEYSNFVDLGYSNNTWVKVDETWHRGARTYLKVNGVWKANTGLVRVKNQNIWK